MLDTIEKTFLFTFKTKRLLSKLTIPVQIPLDISTQEFVGRLVQAHNLPCFVEEGKFKYTKTLETKGAIIFFRIGGMKKLGVT